MVTVSCFTVMVMGETKTCEVTYHFVTNDNPMSAPSSMRVQMKNGEWVIPMKPVIQSMTKEKDGVTKTYTFDGWYLNKSCHGTKYAPGTQAKLTPTTATGAYTLDMYGRWNCKTTTLKKQDITIASSTYKKLMTDGAFNLGAKANTPLIYSSGNTTVCLVDGNGKVTIKGSGKSTITIKAVEDKVWAGATKTVTVQVSKAPQKLTTSANSYSKQVGSSFNLGAKASGGGESHATKSWYCHDNHISIFNA